MNKPTLTSRAFLLSKFYFLLLFCVTIGHAAFAQSNVKVVNPPSQPVAIGSSNGTNVVVYRIGATNKDLNAVTITTITTVWTPASGKKFRLMGGSISVSAAANVLFEDNAAGTGNFVFRTPKLAADTPFNFVVLGGQGKLSATADNVLKATASAAGAITGTIYGTEE